MEEDNFGFRRGKDTIECLRILGARILEANREMIFVLSIERKLLTELTEIFYENFEKYWYRLEC